MKVPIWNIIGFQERDRQDSPNLNNDTFVDYLLLVLNIILELKKNPNSGILINYDDDDYTQGYSQIKEVFRALTKDDIFQPYISDDNFRTSNVRADDVGYNLYVFDKRYQ